MSYARADSRFIGILRGHSIRALNRMFRPDKKMFVFCLRRTPKGILPEGLSRRYTAISLIGLSKTSAEEARFALSGNSLQEVCHRLVSDIDFVDNLGDIALSLWAASACGYPNRDAIWSRIQSLHPEKNDYPTVELAWTLSALCVDTDAPFGELRSKIARRLLDSQGEKSSLFPHVIGRKGIGLRDHVACFADMVYPIQALSLLHKLDGDSEPLQAAMRCAGKICMLQGDDGQWWWHYDQRSGEIVERYPVYAIHQDAMAPMALFALKDAGGTDHTREIGKGLEWLVKSPEIGGGSLVDGRSDVIWRKVARREPGKLTRYLQAFCSRVHPAFRLRGTDLLFPPIAIDYEDRPYHLGWLLFAWSESRARTWNGMEVQA